MKGEPLFERCFGAEQSSIGVERPSRSSLHFGYDGGKAPVNRDRRSEDRHDAGPPVTLGPLQ